MRVITTQEFEYYVSSFSRTVSRTAMCYVKNKACFIRITANMCRNMLKSPWKRLIQPIESAEKLTAEDKKDSRLLEIIMKIKSKNRIVLYMHYYEGYTTRKIAESFDKIPSKLST